MSIEASLERIADALEVIAASKTAGASAPRVEETATTKTETKPDTAAEDKKKAEAKAKRDAKAAADKAAKDKEAAAAVKPKASADPLDSLDDEGDPLGGPAPSEKKAYTEKDVRDILAKVIDREGRAAAFEILRDKGNAKSFTELKPEKYEDVYVEALERVG